MFLRPFGSCVLTVASATLRDVERQALTRFLCLLPQSYAKKRTHASFRATNFRRSTKCQPERLHPTHQRGREHAPQAHLRPHEDD